MTEPKSFLNFIKDANGTLPTLIYKAKELPACEVVERGSDGGCLPGSDDAYEVYKEWDSDASYVLVITEGTAIPGRWLRKIKEISLDWIRVSPESIKTMISSSEPYICIWRYQDGPRPWCQHGGDEDWTTIMKTDDYKREEYGPLLRNGLSTTDYEETDDIFTIITAAHA